jgi:hypothetical protein
MPNRDLVCNDSIREDKAQTASMVYNNRIKSDGNGATIFQITNPIT